ncbi:hypothetical protein FY534_07595 [Alicyclobacillus sp. TC]|uniref:Uncharacterized protein n=1 Tax=Alicyclobacillus tolerans TaxID=90970 RepID=A0ABT9LZ85_9BACL|nr:MULTISPECIES: hypothetical protein [Alicyclobacillus]MDP9729572.1 hypothetical protein [Alicyclobacillus tengchongensis]QRF23548.1 hypothetical protein FY534_07595 [Alicyclobacillus sp. TC]
MENVWKLLWTMIRELIDFQHWKPNRMSERLIWCIFIGFATLLALANSFHWLSNFNPIRVIEWIFKKPTEWIYGGNISHEGD